MSQATLEVASTVSSTAPVVETGEQAAVKRAPLSRVFGISTFTLKKLLSIVRNPSPKELHLYTGVLALSPSTISALRAEVCQPIESVKGAERAKAIALLDRAEAHIDLQMLEYMDS